MSTASFTPISYFCCADAAWASNNKTITSLLWNHFLVMCNRFFFLFVFQNQFMPFQRGKTIEVMFNDLLCHFHEVVFTRGKDGNIKSDHHGLQPELRQDVHIDLRSE